MATNFPSSVDNFTNPTSNDSLNSPSHSLQHANANDAIEAIEGFLLNTYQPSFRNAIINGDFRIWQRGTSFTSNGVYTADRWVMGFGGTGTAMTTSQVALTAGNPISNYEPQFALRCAVTGGSGTSSLVVLTQKIEDVRSFAGKTVTVSFWAKASSGTPSIGLDLYQEFGTTGSPSATVSNGGTKIAITTSWARYSATISLASISGKTITENSLLGMRFWFSSGSDYNSLNNSLGIQSNTFDIWGVQVEAGSGATPFEQRPIGTELALCQRYYVRCTGEQVLQPGFARTSTVFTGAFSLPVEMRTTPTVETNTSNSVSYCSVEVGLNDYTSMLLAKTAGSNSGTRAIGINATNGAAGMTAGYGGITRIVNSAGYIGLIAEL